MKTFWYLYCLQVLKTVQRLHETFWYLSCLQVLKTVQRLHEDILVPLLPTSAKNSRKVTWGHFGISLANNWLTLKEPGYFDPSHSRRGADTASLKISETDQWNIKCVVLVDSYDPPPSPLVPKKFKTYLVWCHSDVISGVMYTKITKNCQNHGFSLFFQAKVAFFSNDVCQSMLTHVLTPNKPNK